jgi:hypothetical protein
MNCACCGDRFSVPEEVECDLCSGHGYLEHEAKPIMGVVGYE